MIRKNIIVVVLFLILIPQLHAVSFIPLDDLEHRFIYKHISRSEISYKTTFSYQLAPYFLPDSQLHQYPISFLNIRSHDQVNLFFKFNEKFHSSKYSHPISNETLQGKLFASPFKNIYIYSSISLDEEKANDPAYKGKKWRGLAGGVDQSFVAYNSNAIDGIAGRFKSYWGIENSLVLSAQTALDGIAYSVKWKKLILSYRLAKLNQQNNSLDNFSFENRFFAGHRLDINLTNSFRVGLFETVIFGGLGRTLEFNYLNPILFFHSDQLNDNTNDNTFLGFDFSYYYHKTKIYGQLVVDDMQIEKESQGDQEPNEIAYTIGFFSKDIIENTDAKLEYTRITNRTYNQAFELNRYTINNRSIGYFNANDFDLVNLELSHWFNSKTMINVNSSYKRQGEGSINDIWTEPWLDIDGDYSEKFPTGSIEKHLTIKVGIKSFIRNHLFLKSDVGYHNVNNYQHIESKNRGFINVSLYLSLFLTTSH